jgi:hypothetical protein
MSIFYSQRLEYFPGSECLHIPTIILSILQTLFADMTRYDQIADGGNANDTRVGMILGVETTLFILGLLLYTLRMYSRIRPKLNLGWDDLFITLAVVSIALEPFFKTPLMERRRFVAQGTTLLRS